MNYSGQRSMRPSAFSGQMMLGTSECPATEAEASKMGNSGLNIATPAYSRHVLFVSEKK